METTDNWVGHPLTGTFTYKRCAYFYQRWGEEAKPVVVLLHGFMQSLTSWDVVARSLQNQFCVYAFDFIGHGLTDKSTKPARYTYKDMAASVDYFIRKVIGASRVHVVGYSMGGRIALQLLRTSSDKLASLTLESCNVGCATHEEYTQATQRNQSWIDKIRRDGMESFVSYWETLPLFATQKELGYDKMLHCSRAANNPECMVLCLEGAGKQAMPLCDDTLKVIKQAIQKPTVHAGGQREGRNQDGLPIHYIYGRKDEKSKVVADLLSSIGVCVSEIDAGHNVHLEEPTLYCKEVQNFLLKVDNR